MKQTNFLKSFFLLCALIVGSSSVWGQEQTYSTCLFGGTHGGSNNYTTTWTATNGDFSWSVANGNTNKNNTEWDYVKFGRRDYTSVGKVTTSNKYSAAITKVVVTIDAITANKINSIKLYTSSNNTTWTEAGTFTKATGAQSVTLSSPTSDLYYKVEFDCASGSSNGLISVSKIEYKYSADGSKSTTTTVSPTDWTFNLAEGVNNTKALSATVTNDENDSEIVGATVTWESSNEDVATVNSSGVVAPVGVGTATITATYAGVAKKWAESSGTCAVTVENVFSTIDLTSTASLSFTDFSVLDNSTSAYYYDDDDIDFDGSDGKSYRWKLKDASNQYTTSTTMRLKPNSGYVKFPSVTSTYGYVVNIAYTSGGTGKPSINDGETTTTIENNTDFIVSKATAPLNIMNSSNNVITISRITITPAKILAPTIALAAGTYKTAQTTKLTNVAGFGYIYYTTDGSDPTAGGGTLYTTDDDIAINNGLTLKAAVKHGTDWGYVSEATYVIKPDAPVLGTDPGDFYDDFTLTVTAGDGLTIRYTTDGTEPTTSSTLYETGVEISCNAGESVTVKAKAFDTYNNASDMVSATYSKIKHTATMSFASTSLTVKTTSGPVTETLPTLTVASEDGDASDAESAVYYSSSDTETATVNALTGAVTAVKAGTVTITAAISDNINWYNVSTSYSLTLGYSDAEVEFENSSKTVTYGETFNGFTATKTTTASLTYTSSNPKVATVVAGTGAVTILSVGETTITASAPEQNPYNAGEASYTLTVNEITSYPTALQTILDEKFSKLTNNNNAASAANCDVSGWTLSNTYQYSGGALRIATSSSGSATTPVLVMSGTKATLKFKARGWDSDELQITISGTNCQVDGKTSQTITNLPYNEFTEKTFEITKTDDNPKIVFSASGSKRVIIDDVLVEVNVQTVPVTINASGLTSFCSPYKLDLDDEASQCEAWAISSYDVDNKKINFQKVTGVVPANTPLILMGEEGEKTMAVCQDENEEGVAPSPNKLRGFISPTYYAGPTAAETYFGLVKSTGNFKKMNAGTIPAGKAVLVMDTDDAKNLDFSDGSKFTFFFEESTETDGIRTTNVNVQVFDGNYYNLAGQRVSENYKGVVIYNGKKIIKK